MYVQPAIASVTRLCFDERPCQLLNQMMSLIPTKPGATRKKYQDYSTNPYGAFYKHPPVERARQLRHQLDPHFTPVHGSWLNMVKIEFAVLDRQVLNRTFADETAVQAAGERCKNRQNTESKPRNWQFTTANARIKPAKLYPTIQYS